jgi:phage terminase large subunit-like protein
MWLDLQLFGALDPVCVVNRPTAADVRDVMVEGPSGIMNVCPPRNRPLYEPSKRRITWPKGVMATTYSADEPERLRGPQHGAAWYDELGSWRYPDTWDQLMFGLRAGDSPRVLVTTTPRPTKIIRELIADPHTVVVRGSSHENRANLSPVFFDRIVARYAGTRLGRQEIEAEILDDVPGALWRHELIDAARIATPPQLRRVVVAIDPAVTSGEDADETGIVVVGRDDAGHGYVLADASGRMAPVDWASHRRWRLTGRTAPIESSGNELRSGLGFATKAHLSAVDIFPGGLPRSQIVSTPRTITNP